MKRKLLVIIKTHFLKKKNLKNILEIKNFIELF